MPLSEFYEKKKKKALRALGILELHLRSCGPVLFLFLVKILLNCVFSLDFSTEFQLNKFWGAFDFLGTGVTKFSKT